MPASPPRVAILSEQDIVRLGLVAMLSEHPDRVRLVEWSPAPDGTPAPDVVLYDVVGLVDGDGGDLEQLVKETPAAVVAVAQDLRPDLAARALAKGAQACVSSAAHVDEILAVIDDAGSGELVGDLALGSSDPVARAAVLGADVGLTPRETDVLGLITQGLSNVEVAAQCYVSINSVKSYIRSAYRKIGVDTRSQAVSWCIQHGFDPTPD